MGNNVGANGGQAGRFERQLDDGIEVREKKRKKKKKKTSRDFNTPADRRPASSFLGDGHRARGSRGYERGKSLLVDLISPRTSTFCNALKNQERPTQCLLSASPSFQSLTHPPCRLRSAVPQLPGNMKPKLMYQEVGGWDAYRGGVACIEG